MATSFIRFSLRLHIIILILCIFGVVGSWQLGQFTLPSQEIYFTSYNSRGYSGVVTVDINRILFAPLYPNRLTSVTSNHGWDTHRQQIVWSTVHGNVDDLMGIQIGGQQGWLTQGGENISPVYSSDGRYIAFQSWEYGKYKIYIMDADGGHRRLLTDATDLISSFSPVWSPDDRHIAFQSNSGTLFGISVIDVDGKNRRLLTPDDEYSVDPAWSPDGKSIAFTSNRDGNLEIYVIDADGSQQRRLTLNDGDDLNPAWSPDGKHIAFASQRNGGFRNIYVMDADGSNLHFLASSGGEDTLPEWSPDGQSILFQASVGRIDKLTYVVNADGSNLRRLTTYDMAADNPIWQVP